ncbi:MAG: DUF1569 domain-containing protein [Bacteroidota bacterium]
MDTDQLNFVNNEFPELLKKLSLETPAKWGLMNAQQMVEHLTDYVRIASGKNPAKIVTSEEQLPAFKRFLESEKQFRPGTVNPVNPGAPNPVRMKNMDESVKEYLIEMNDLHDIFKKESGKITAHPAFGNLNYDEWIRLQYKHLMHHGKQFGLVNGD